VIDAKSIALSQPQALSFFRSTDRLFLPEEGDMLQASNCWAMPSTAQNGGQCAAS
jgi:hypothetical protein